MTFEADLAGLQNEASRLRVLIAQVEEEALREAHPKRLARSDWPLMAMRNRLLVLEHRIAKIKFGSFRFD
ncbi:hypothetical protein NGM99_21350 [Mesorhizobium sp. RP14(2022)]|uniref:IS66 family transposase n=1 Tax=Mesorhizobium liriopis TaxID=2953882 RepID=A0ABT1CBY5_9HYPH|nr:hypothetical protein [Mesorhizobium liriopis]MCO6052339.1 hypothetical protein [Mesorhizobium liriopis]